MVLDSSIKAERRLKSMLFWDTNNRISIRSWVRNKNIIFEIKQTLFMESNLIVTIPNTVDDSLLNLL